MDTPEVATLAGKDRPDLWALGVLPVLSLGALAGLLGIYWDIAWHIDIGRDSFFTLPHNFLYSSIAVVLLTSFYGLLRDRRNTPFHLRLGKLRLHPGILIVAVGAALELLFAPLDELWHELFGIDVTLWAPMHLIGILGLTLASFGGLVSAWLERRLSESRRHLLSGVTLFFAAALLGWLVLLLAEFDFNTPQFPSFWHPVLLVGLPPFVFLLVSRLALGRWAATVTTILYTVFRLGLAAWLITTAGLGWAGATRPLISLVIFSGLAVDLLSRRNLPAWLLGLVAGAVMLAANWLLIAFGEGIVWYPDVLLQAALPGLSLAALMGWLGAWVAAALRGETTSGTADETRAASRSRKALVTKRAEL